MATKPDVRVCRVYDEANDDDGVRVLVDHIGPRGVSKAMAALAEWCKDIGRIPWMPGDGAVVHRFDLSPVTTRRTAPPRARPGSHSLIFSVDRGLNWGPQQQFELLLGSLQPCDERQPSSIGI